jgi:hypothetical protein
MPARRRKEVVLHLADHRTIFGKTEETAEQFAKRWKEALKDSGILVIESERGREYISASQIVSVE